MLQRLYTYVACIYIECFIYFEHMLQVLLSRCCICCSGYTHTLLAYVLNVLFVSDVCYRKCFHVVSVSWAGVGGPVLKMATGTEIRWVFSLLRHGFGLISLLMGLLMDKKLNPAGLQAWVWEHGTQTRKPMGFLNMVYHNIVLAIYTYTNIERYFKKVHKHK